jgi:hypothetical protein
MTEAIAPVGYINERKDLAMIQIHDPILVNGGKFVQERPEFLQVVFTIHGIKELRDQISLFLATHEGPDA